MPDKGEFNSESTDGSYIFKKINQIYFLNFYKLLFIIVFNIYCSEIIHIPIYLELMQIVQLMNWQKNLRKKMDNLTNNQQSYFGLFGVILRQFNLNQPYKRFLNKVSPSSYFGQIKELADNSKST